MSLTPGTRIGPYAIAGSLGAGGMGEVYRATDTNLKRQVAIKVLPSALAGDAERLARFQREAEVLAALNHPHIAAIYGLEKSGGVTALVMELVDGEDLSQRIARGAIPLDEALPIAKQIAEALEAAHERGIIHRDLKPANIKLRADGAVKVLDFGLAKALDSSPASAPADNSPTITSPAMTMRGTILGTAAYMAPEQAKGEAVDRRADVWAFGAVLYQMLTGRRAFTGEDITDTIVSIVSQEPDWRALPAATPPGLRRLLGRCLKKDPRARLQAIGEARVLIDELLGGAPADMADAGVVAPAAPQALRLAWVVLAAAVLAAVALAVPTLRHLRETSLSAPLETRLDIVTQATEQPTSFALSPDGRQIVFVASGDGGSRLWLRSLATTTARPLVGTERAAYPFWSPDGRSIGFFADAKLKRIDLESESGAARTVADANNLNGGTWNADGVILFTWNRSSPLFRVPASGGTPVAITTLAGQTSHRFPAFLPDGRHFLYYAEGTPDTRGIYLGALDAQSTSRLTAADTAGAYLPAGPGSARASRDGGWLLWVREGALVAQRLDLERQALSGDPLSIADPVAVDAATNAAAVSVSVAGLVAYRTGAGTRRRLVWLDRSGRELGALGALDENEPRDLSVSPDGHRAVVSRTVQGNQDLWILDGTRTSRFTFNAGVDRFPLWSPDGSRIVFGINRSGVVDVAVPAAPPVLDLYQKLSSGASAEDLLLASPQGKVATDWSTDGRFLLYNSVDPQGDRDLWVLPMEADRSPWVLLKTPFSERWGSFSPDGRWVAYHSNESGQTEVYVRPFAETAASSAAVAGGQRQVSTSGGAFPRWRRDGKELYYLGPTAAMMAAPITVTRAALEPGVPVVLFPTRIVGGGADTQQGRQYDVTSDGRFLINTVVDEAAAPITLLMNWNPEGEEVARLPRWRSAPTSCRASPA